LEKNERAILFSKKEMIKIKGEEQWQGFRCLNKARICKQWSDPCSGLPEGASCAACSGFKAFVPCVKGSCSDVCNFQYMHCDHWFTGVCSGKTCSEVERKGDCYLPDC